MKSTILISDTPLSAAVTWHHKSGGAFVLFVRRNGLPKTANGNESTNAHRTITFSLYSCPQSWIAAIDWAAFARTAASSLLHLSRVEVRVKEGSSERTEYERHAHQHLKTVCEERGIKLQVSEIQWLVPPRPPGEIQHRTPILAPDSPPSIPTALSTTS